MEPLLTPKEAQIIKNPLIQSLISRFDCQIFSSPAGIKNLEINHRVQNILSKASGSPPPPKPDFSKYSPASIIKEAHKPDMAPAVPIKCEPGYIQNASGKIIFDTKWQEKGIHPTELPKNHPDYSPF